RIRNAITSAFSKAWQRTFRRCDQGTVVGTKSHGMTSEGKYGEKGDRPRCRADHETLRPPPRSGDAQGQTLAYGGILAADRRRVHESCEFVPQPGKRLASPGGWVLGYGGCVRAAWSAQ